MVHLRALVFAVLTALGTNAAQYGWNAAQAQVLANWWGEYAKGVAK